MGIPGHLTCLLKNLYACQEATVRTGYGKTGWFQIQKGGCQGCILSHYLFNSYAEYIMRHSGLDEAQAGIKIASRNISTFRCADDTSLIAESEELKSLLLKMKEENEEAGLKQYSKNEDHDIWSHHFITNRWGKSGNSEKFYFLGSKVTEDGDYSHEIKRYLLLGRKAMTNLDSILKSRDITLLTKAHIVNAMVFLVVVYEFERWTINKAEH